MLGVARSRPPCGSRGLPVARIWGEGSPRYHEVPVYVWLCGLRPLEQPPVPGMPPSQRPPQTEATPPPLPRAGRQFPSTCPLTEKPPPPPHVAKRPSVLNGPGTPAPAGRSGPQLSPRRGRPAASPAWRPRGAPSPALRRSNVTQPTPTPRANRGARPRLSAPHAARRRNPVLLRPPLPSAPYPTPEQFHLYSQA